MKDNPKNALMIVAALLVVYVGAFFGTMEVKPLLSSAQHQHWFYSGWYVPRWAGYQNESIFTQGMVTFFAPLIWVEEQVRPPGYWEWKEGQPKPDWMKPSTP